MENIKKIIASFLQDYKNEDYFIGAILTGSYATGNNDINSDIDIFIITKDSTPWRERGNRLIDGYMVEYFINPLRQVVKEFDEGFATGNIATTLMFAGSVILRDTDGIVTGLVERAKSELGKPIASASGFKWNSNCYNVWHSFTQLDAKYIKGADIDFTYNIFLTNIISAHFSNRGIPGLSMHKIERILTDEQYRKKYNNARLPEREFCEKLVKCFDEKDYHKKYLCAKELYVYYMAQNSNFDINNYSFRSSI